MLASSSAAVTLVKVKLVAASKPRPSSAKNESPTSTSTLAATKKCGSAGECGSFDSDSCSVGGFGLMSSASTAPTAAASSGSANPASAATHALPTGSKSTSNATVNAAALTPRWAAGRLRCASRSISHANSQASRQITPSSISSAATGIESIVLDSWNRL